MGMMTAGVSLLVVGISTRTDALHGAVSNTPFKKKALRPLTVEAPANFHQLQIHFAPVHFRSVVETSPAS